MALPCSLSVLIVLIAVVDSHAEVQVLFGDCADVLDDARCIPKDDRRITLWIRPDPGLRVALRDQNGELAVQTVQRIDGGARYAVELGPDSRRVDVVHDDAPDEVLWSLTLVEEPEAPELARVRALFVQREYDRCEALLATLTSDDDYARRGGAERLAGIFYHNRGEPERARDFYRRAIASLRAAGRTLEAVRAASALSYLSQHTLRDFAGARAALDALTPTARWPAEAQYFAAYDRALLAFNGGDPRAALAAFDDAARIARRMGGDGNWLRRRVDAEELMASQLQRIGRREDARALFDALRNEDLGALSDCERAQFHSNAAWSELLILEAGDDAPDPSAALEALVSTMREQCRTGDLVTLHIHRALAHWHAERLGQADAALRDAQSVTDRPELRLRFWEMDIAARIAAARGDTDKALATLSDMEQLAGATLSPDARWRAASRRGEVLEQAGRVDEALAAYETADAVLRDDLSRVPLAAGRGPFSASRDWATRRRLALLVARGDDPGAAALVRAANLRATLTVSAQRQADDDTLARLSAMRLAISEDIGSGWRVPADELAVLEARRTERERSLSRAVDKALADHARPFAAMPAVMPGDAHIALYPLVRDWALAVWHEGGARILAFDCDDGAPAAVAQCALDAAGAMLAGTARLVVLDGSRLAQADVAGLTLDGRRVIDTHRVVYSAGRFDVAAWPRAYDNLAVVGDPTRQLPRSRAEAMAVADAARAASGVEVAVLTGREATFQAVRAQLDAAGLWHFAGHAQTAGSRPWHHALALARGETLSVADVLALPRSPRFVVLSACATSAAAAADQHGATGLAQAFIVAGAQAVLATSRAVRDADAQQVMRAFYARWTDSTSADEALAAAQRGFAARDDDVDWPAFRLLVR